MPSGASRTAEERVISDLRASEDRFRLLVESVQDYAIIALDPTGHVTSWNSGAQRIKGYSADEIIGRHLSTFYLPDDVEAGVPESLLRRAALEGRVEAEGWRVRKDGTTFWADIVITALFDDDHELTGFGKVTRDVTERRAADAALRASEDRFRLLVESVQDYAIIALDPTGHVTSWNSGAKRIKGYSAEEIVGRHLSTFYLPDDVEAGVPDRLLRTAAVEGRVEAEGWRVRKDGTTFWADIVITALYDDDHELTGFGKVTRDVTERRAADAALQATAVRLEEARAEQERLAVTDGLTDVYNRRFFQEYLQLEAERSDRRGTPLSLIVADIDHFKRVNDRYGHPVGDLVLREAATRLRAVTRSSDAVARYGGEEFAIVLPETGPAEALEVAERCRQLIAATPVELDHDAGASGPAPAVRVTASFGVATLWSIGDGNVSDLVRAADRALYRSKSTGRNRVCPAGDWDFSGEAGSPDATATATEEPDLVADALLRAAELVDADQGPDEHGAAVARWAGRVADRLGVPADLRDRCMLAAQLHDVGKLAMPRSVLTKAGRLTEDEWSVMRTHPQHSEALVALSPTLADLGPIVRAHHEWFDGTGYPDGLAGDTIPLEARVIAVCDSWAAMRAHRVYAAPRSATDSRRELLDGRGTQFDPAVVDAFLELQEGGRISELHPVGHLERTPDDPSQEFVPLPLP